MQKKPYRSASFENAIEKKLSECNSQILGFVQEGERID
jgi:hypothetical protein